jgi:hypothetical protein
MPSCTTCQNTKRAEIDRRLAAGEPGNQIARAYELNPSSLHRHRAKCLRLSSSNAIMKEAARGTAALACLPSKDDLHQAYFELCTRIDEIVKQAQDKGSLAIALNGLNSIRHTLDSLTKLAGHDRPNGGQASPGGQAQPSLEVAKIADRLIQAFDHEPELKARIAQALMEIDHEAAA